MSKKQFHYLFFYDNIFCNELMVTVQEFPRILGLLYNPGALISGHIENDIFAIGGQYYAISN